MTMATATWPTVSDYDEAHEPLAEAVEEVFDLLGRLQNLEKVLDGPNWKDAAPTLEQIGALALFVENARADVASLTEYVAGAEKVLLEAAPSPHRDADDAR
jgi:hypothetical protein